MRAVCASLVLFCLLHCQVVQASDEFPIVAYVKHDWVNLRGDPSRSFPPTSKLPQGARVEIWRQADGGWLGIRPPQGSYNWVPQEFLRPTKTEGIYAVTMDGVKAWIGHQAKNDRHNWQTQLKPNELVEVLPKKSAFKASDGESWVRIAPPSGEFRWIRSQDIDWGVKGVDVEADPSSTNNVAEPEKPTGEIALTGSLQEVTNTNPRQAANSAIPKWKPRTPTARVARATTPGRSRSTLVRPKTLVPSSETLFRRELASTDVKLTRIVSEEPHHWRLAPLRERVEQLVDGAPSAFSRGRATVILDRIEQFGKIAQQYEKLAKNERSRRAAVARTAKAQTVRPTFSSGRGWLMPVGPPQRGRRFMRSSGPAFALTDEHGNILQFVSPSQGIDLRKHVRSQVAIEGKRDVKSVGRTPHLVVERITPLASRRR